MRNPLFRSWRDLFRRPSPARFVPTDLGDVDLAPKPKPHPKRRKTDKWPRE